MSEDNTEQRKIFPAPTSENARGFPIEFENAIDASALRILDKIKWQLGFTRRREVKKTPFDPRRFEVLLDGCLRGDFAERLSVVLPISQGETVFSIGDFAEIEMAAFETLTGQHAKEQILAYAVTKSLQEVPLKNFRDYLRDKGIGDGETRKRILEQMEREIVIGFSCRGNSSFKAGILYADTVIPDGVLVDTKGEVVGFTEVKAYLPEEFDVLLRYLKQLKAKGGLTHPNGILSIERGGVKMDLNLGADIFGEIKFVDNFRRVGYGLEDLDREMPILLRFPSDVSDESLKSYGETLQELGLSNILIQRLPVSSSQLSERARRFVGDHLGKIKGGATGLTYSKREARVLGSYANPKLST